VVWCICECVLVSSIGLSAVGCDEFVLIVVLLSFGVDVCSAITFDVFENIEVQPTEFPP